MKNILITGHEGYIGKHLVKLIEEEVSGVQVYGLDLMGRGQHYGDIRFAASDIQFHTIIHLAALVQVGDSVERPTEYFDTNVNGTLNLLQRFKFHNFILASTGAAAQPDSPYGLSKRMAETLVKEHAYDYTIFRFHNVTGTEGYPATNPDGLFFNLNKAIKTKWFNLYGTDYNTKDGTAVREYVHVMDICRALVKAIDDPAKDIENLAYGETKTVKEIIDIFKKVNGVKFKVNERPRREGDLEECHLEKPSRYMERNYTYEEMLKL